MHALMLSPFVPTKLAGKTWHSISMIVATSKAATLMTTKRYRSKIDDHQAVPFLYGNSVNQRNH